MKLDRFSMAKLTQAKLLRLYKMEKIFLHNSSNKEVIFKEYEILARL